MKKNLLVLLSLLTLLSLASAPGASNAPRMQEEDGYTFKQKIPINLVFIGYEKDQIDPEVVMAELPETYVPVIRAPLFYGLSGRDLGLKFNFDYRPVFAPTQFEQDFFQFLESAGKPGHLTRYQFLYNRQKNNILKVSGPVLRIDAPSVEQWLSDHAAPLVEEPFEKSYTVFFINWYGQPNFHFHVYTKTDDPDPDTGVNFGAEYGSTKMIAWGGSHSRSWFYDLSAGPEWNTSNYDVDHPDLDGNGIEDYRMPPVWEYAPEGYRQPAALSSDLGKVTRYVAINLLFTSSPLFDPLVTAPGPGGSKIKHIEMFEDDPESQGVDWIDTNYIADQLKAFQPYYPWQVNLEQNDPIDPGAQRAFRIFAGLLEEEDCWTIYGTPFTELFCYFDANLASYVPEYGRKDYVGETFAFNTTDENMGEWIGLLGFADDNWVDGTQTYIYEFDTASNREFGYGFSVTDVHEFGHHIGMSHPHDGYDSESGIDYGPVDDFYYAWSGDESATVMQYLAVHNSFGRFDQDNMYRYEAAGYVKWTRDLLKMIQEDPSAADLVQQAQQGIDQAVEAFEQWDYLQAATSARQAYEAAATAAETLGIQPPALANALRAGPVRTVPLYEDPIRIPDE